MTATLQNFNQDSITEPNIEECSGKLKCKIDLPGDNNPCTITRKRHGGSPDYGNFELDSSLYTNFKYGGKLYNVDSCYFTYSQATGDESMRGVPTPSSIPDLITNFYGSGIIGQIIIIFNDKKTSNKKLNLIIPIYSGRINNNVGKYLLSSIAKISDPGLKSTLKLNNIIPKKTEFYHLETTTGSGSSKKTYNNIIFSGSKIIVQESTYVLIWWNGGSWSGSDGTLQTVDTIHANSAFASPPSSENRINGRSDDTDYTSELRESISEKITFTGSNIPKASKNKEGIVSTLHGTSIINCAPVDDNGMLLTDREKGLGNEGITKTTSMESLTRKYTQGTMAQMIIGAVLLFFLTKMVRSTLSMLDKK